MPRRRTPRRFFAAGIALLAGYVVAYLVYFTVLPMQTPPVSVPVWAGAVAGTIIQASLTFGALCLVASWVTDYLAEKLESIGAAPDAPPEDAHLGSDDDAA